jgi:hypothetical protein
MVLSELIQRSPVRIFEKSIHGGLNSGEIGVIASQRGIGKTSVLVQLALDKLLQGEKIIHVSFTQHTHNVLRWYENIFSEFISKKNLENAGEIKNDLVKNRVLMNFNQDGVSKEMILKSLRAMIVEGGFKAKAIIIDGFDFSRANQQNIADVKAFAKELELSIWYTCNIENTGQQYDKQNIPLVIKDYADLFDVVVVLEPKTDYIEFSVSKDRDALNAKSMAAKLDPKTMLILEV